MCSINYRTSLIKYIFRKERKSDLYPSPGVLSQGEEWHKNRSAVQQDMMRPKSAMQYISDIEKITEELLDLMREKRDHNHNLDVHPLLKLWSLESIASIFLAKRLYCFHSHTTNDDGKMMVDANRTMNQANLQLFIFPKIWQYFPHLIPAYRRFSKATETMVNYTKATVDIALAKLDLENESEQSILAKFARRNGRHSPLCSTMAQDAMIAGIDTTGTTSTFLLYHLATNPMKQEILYKEISDVVGSNNESITEAKLSKMRYLKACLHESQRISPATVGTSRMATQDYVLDGYQIPKGTLVIYFWQVASNSSSNFVNPEEYRPERWLRSSPESGSAHPFSSIPFGHGPRSCIGRRFATMEVYCLAIKMLQKFRLEYHGPPVDVITEFLNVPDKDVVLKLIDRNQG